MIEEHAVEGKPGKFGGHFALALFFDRALETLAMHSRLWPIVLELTGGFTAIVAMLRTLGDRPQPQQMMPRQEQSFE